MSNPTILKDSVWAVASQGISMLTGIVMSLILPKFITVETFGYWQLFLLYASYVGLLHFGAGDGIYLRLGGQYFDKIDRCSLYPQIQLVSVSQIIFAAVIAIYACIFVDDATRQFIFLALSAFIVVDNVYKILSFVLMATDKMIFNSRTVIIDKVLMLLSTVLLIVFIKLPNAKLLISAYVCSHIVVLIITLAKFKGIFKFHRVFNKQNYKSVVGLASVGIVLTLSNLMSTLIVGSCRLIVERYWDITVFAQLSFAITISVFILTFVSQISYVLFPYLRRMNADNQRTVLRDSNFVLTCVVPYLYAFVFPLYYFILLWLPKYVEAAHYMTLIAPICFYEMRMSLLFNTYFKNLNKIRPLLIINIVTVVVAVLLYFVSVWVHSMEYISVSVLISLIFKTLMMQYYLYRHYQLSREYIYLSDIVFTLIMTGSFLYGGINIAAIAYIVYILSYSLFIYRNALPRFKEIKNNFRNY